MGNFQDEQKEKERRLAHKDRRLEREAGLCFDVAKLSIGGMVIGAFVPILTNESASVRWEIAVNGLLVAGFFIYLGHKLLK